ncbi:hypothetical protein Tco_0506750 [Tanacetum coccineum]
MHVHYQSIGKTISDVDFFMERGTSPSTGRFSWSFNDSNLFSEIFIDSNLFSRIFNTSTLFFRSFNTSKIFSRNFKKCRVLKLQALAWKDNGTRGNSGNVYASGATYTYSTALLHEVYNDIRKLGLE